MADREVVSGGTPTRKERDMTGNCPPRQQSSTRITLGRILILSLLLSPAGAPAEGVTLASLLEEMTDRDRLARLPDPPYTCRQASSYDRRSTDPADVSTWFANMDRSHFVRTETQNGRTEHVLMDEAGPGAVVRFWATWHGPGGGPFSNGTLRIYLDLEPEPAIEAPMRDVISGGLLCPPPLSQSVSPLTEGDRRGHNLYLPVPYAKHCKITYETPAPIDPGAHRGEALYYQINYRTYAADTDVTSFRADQLKALGETVSRTGTRLLNPEPSPEGLRETALDGTIPPRGSSDVDLSGPGAVRVLTINLEADNLAQALQSTVVELTFDGQTTAWCPVGALYGTGHRFSPHRSWVTQIREDGSMQVFWIMPFETSARITLRNLGLQPVTVRGSVLHGPWSWDDRSMHFYATWRQWTKLMTQTQEGADHGAFDLNYVTVHGTGVYVGDTLALFNGAAAWWGEGDEKIYVDGERFPSHFGTGTEDYYGYAWSNPNFFDAPFHTQPFGRGANQPDVAVNSRYRALDAIPFSRSIRVDMEVWHWHRTRMNFAPATFWYARPGTRNPLGPTRAVSFPVPISADDIVPVVRVPGAIEGEALAIIHASGGTTEVQHIPPFGWSGHEQLWWRDATTHDTLTLGFDAEREGRYEVTVRLTRAPDYGRVHIGVNGTLHKPNVELYRDPLDTFDVLLPNVPLNAGQNLLEFGIMGAHPKAVKRHMVGLDYLLLKRIADPPPMPEP